MGSILSFWTDPQNLISFGKAAFGLGLVIFVHELGHFLVAKACGVKCEKFYVGFDVPLKLGPIKLPSSLFKKQVGETEYGIGIIPLGGYVKMLGQDDNPGAAAAENERIRVQKEGVAEGEEDYELDPRSYPAKTVPQRMAIISAGVIMNLIFGVVFATVAYRYGVKYLPCVIGSTMPGDPAWTAGLQPGDKIVQLGKEGEPSNDLRFTRELRYKVVETGDGNLLPIRIRHNDGSESWLDVTPNTPFKKETGLPTIGVLSGNSNVVADVPLDNYTLAAKSDLQAGDRIVQASAGGETRSVNSYLDLFSFLLEYSDQEVELQVERQREDSSAATELNVTLPAQALRTFGMQMQMGPILSVQAGSPAAVAGIRTGDQIIAIDDQPVADPMLIDDQLSSQIGQEIKLSVQRGQESMQLMVTPQPRRQLGWPRRMGGAVSVETLGVAFIVADAVASVTPGGPADLAGLQKGDQIQSFMFAAQAGAEFSNEEAAQLKLGVETKFTPEQPGWATFFRNVQEMPELEVHVQYQRGSELKSAIMNPVASDEWFFADRGIICKQLSETRIAGSWSEAFRLGVRETKEGIGHVFFTLSKIKDLYRSLGGPVAIGAIATSEASEGIPRLLIFLTLLSANLAVLNFLPIPVLDGGHMMFLLYEGIFGKPVNERVAFGLTMLGLSFILALMVFVIGMDFYRFAG
jgi:regulator of sigma E protease